MAKAMTSQTIHRHNIGRRRYHDVHAQTTSQVFPLHDVPPLRAPRVRKLASNGNASYAPDLHAGMTAVSTPYKASRVLWLEGDAAQLSPISYLDLPGEGWKRQVEHRTSRSAEDELVAVLRQFIGSWVAIRGPEVIASSSSPLAVVSFLREHNLRADSILRVPRDPVQEVEGD